MPSNSFGQAFRIMTWGESHGPVIGVTIDGCPAGLEISESDIQGSLDRRAPGKTPWVSPRKELDHVEIVSGIFEGCTTGAPISLLIHNRNKSSKAYQSLREIIRPGHANATYLKKYGVFDYLGGGRASARETACRVAAGAIAAKLLKHFNIECIAYLKEAGGISLDVSNLGFEELRERTYDDPLFCPNPKVSHEIALKIEAAKKTGDSLGGIIEARATLPAGIGTPVYERLDSKLAYACLSIPACKGFEIGSGFAAAKMMGSEHNDQPLCFKEGLKTKTNHAGGVLAGISTGMPLIFRAAFKPTSSIEKPQKTITLSNESVVQKLPRNSRHDPCVTIRAAPIVEAMTALVLADLLLMHQTSRIDQITTTELDLLDLALV